MKTNTATIVAAALAASLASAGCFSIKTESEIKPIHITMDVNLNIDNKLDKAFADDTKAKPRGSFAEVKALLDRGAAGVTNKAMLEPRDGATDDDRIFVAEENMKRLRRFNDIAKESGVAVEAVQKRQWARIRENIPAGSGVWCQDESGTWTRK